MKSLKITLTTACLILSGFLVKASSINSSDDKLTASFAINAYIDAFSHGKPAELNEILDKNAKMTIQRANSILTYTKAEIIQNAKNQEGVEQNCKTSYSVMENLPGQVIVKMNMAYADFSRVNYITLLQTGKGWKITNVSSVFK